MREFKLPPAIAELVSARNKVRAHYQSLLTERQSTTLLHFTLDGNLVGDIGEAIAFELFGVQLVNAKSTEGIDGYAPDGRTVQVKATGTNRGPAFRPTQIRANHLLFFELNLEEATGTVIFNGPEHIAFSRFLRPFAGQRSLTPGQIRAADRDVQEADRLPMLGS